MVWIYPNYSRARTKPHVARRQFLPLNPMRSAFHNQLDALTRSIGDMCGLAGTAMQHATQALLEADIVLAETVIRDHQSLVAQAAETESDAIKLAVGGGVRPSTGVSIRTEVVTAEVLVRELR